MSRRRAAVKKKILPDAKFGDVLLTKFINCIMYQGKKSVAESIVYGALERVQSKLGKNGIEIFHESLTKIRPAIEVRSRRVGGATYQVPTEVRADRATALSMRWLINSSRARSENTMEERLAGELMDASSDKGASIKKRDDTHKMAEANRAFAHYRW